MVKLILFVCFYCIVPIQFFVLRNESKRKKNIVLGVTLPYEAREMPEVEEICARFRRGQTAALAVLTVTALPALLLPGCADLYSLKTLRASMGAVFRLPAYTVDADALRALLTAANLPLYGAALRHDTVDVRCRDLRRCAIAVGSEGRGLSDTVLALCDETLRIPMADHCESLNAAAAAAVLLWEAYRAEEGM